MNITATSNGRQDILIHQPFDCLFSSGVCSSTHQRNHQKPRHGLLWGEIPSQRASCTENVSISWRRHESKKNWRYKDTKTISTETKHNLTSLIHWRQKVVIMPTLLSLVALHQWRQSWHHDNSRLLYPLGQLWTTLFSISIHICAEAYAG